MKRITPTMPAVLKKSIHGDIIYLWFNDNEKLLIDINKTCFYMQFWKAKNIKSLFFSERKWELLHSKTIIISNEIDDSKQLRGMTVEKWNIENRVHYIIACFLEEIREAHLKNMSVRDKLINELF